MAKYAKIENDPSLKRDMETGVLIGTRTELEVYRKNRAKIIHERERDRKISSIENEMRDIRQLLNELLTKLSGQD